MKNCNRGKRHPLILHRAFNFSERECSKIFLRSINGDMNGRTGDKGKGNRTTQEFNHLWPFATQEGFCHKQNKVDRCAKSELISIKRKKGLGKINEKKRKSCEK